MLSEPGSDLDSLRSRPKNSNISAFAAGGRNEGTHHILEVQWVETM